MVTRAGPAKPTPSVWKKVPYLPDEEVTKFFAAVTRAREAKIAKPRAEYLAAQEAKLEAELKSLAIEKERIDRLIAQVGQSKGNQEMRTRPMNHFQRSLGP